MSLDKVNTHRYNQGRYSTFMLNMNLQYLHEHFKPDEEIFPTLL